MTNSNKLQELVESVDSRFDKKFYMLPDNGFFFKDNIKTFLHQVILETVEVVGKEIIGGMEKYEEPFDKSIGQLSERNELRAEQRERLSQLMDSLEKQK